MPAPRLQTVSARIADAPGWALAVILAVHAAIWTVLPGLLYANPPPELIAALTGHAWEVGYAVPPAAYYLLAQVAVVAALALVYAAARPLTGPIGALVAVLIADGLQSFSTGAADFDHNLMQLPLWALAGYALLRARRGGIGNWLLLALAAGALLLTVLVDAASLAAQRNVPAIMAADHLWQPLQFALDQALVLSLPLLIAAPLFWPRGPVAGNPAPADPAARRTVGWLTFAPAAAALVLTAVTGRGAVVFGTYPLWLFVGLWLVLTARSAIDGLRFNRIVMLWAAVFAGLALVFVGTYALLPGYDHRDRAVLFPGQSLAAQVAGGYRALTGQPLTYVIGSLWEGGNVSYYAPGHPRLLIDANPDRAPWIDLEDLKARGAVLVWTDGDPANMPVRFHRLFADAQIQTPFTLRYRRGDGEVTVGWAVLLPRPAFAALTPAR